MKKLFTTLSVLLMAAATMAQVPNYVPTNGLVGYWPFNGNANDESGNGNNGTVNGATLTTDRNGNANAAYFFTNDVININNGNIGAFGLSSFSCAVWVKFTNPGLSLGNFIRYGNGVNGSGWGLRNTGDSKINGLSYEITTNNVFSSNPYNDDNWHLAVFVRDVNQLSISLYIDGVFVNSSPMMSNYTNNIQSGLPLNFGSANGYENFFGSLDDIGIWNRALTEQEITDLYTGGQPVCLPSYVPTNGLVGYWPFCGNANDESGNGNNGTVNGATLTTDRFGNPNAAYDFDGSDDSIEIENLESFDFSNAIGISFWLYVEQFPTSGGRVILSKQLSSSTSAIGFAVTATDNETVTFRLGNGSPVSYTAVVNNSISAQVWHHVVCDFENGTIRVFIDSNETGSTTQQNASVGQASLPMLIGAPTWSASNAFSFFGALDDFGIWNRALTPCEIQSLYTGQILTPPTATITPNGNTTICSGGFVQLTASTGDSYLWSNGETTQTITATQADNYTVTVTDENGCSATSTPVTVTVNPTPNSGVTVGGATTFCSGGSVTLTSQASSGSYLWSNGETTQSITVNQTGNYSVTVTENGCSATSGSTAVTVNQTPTATITPQGNTTFCQGGFVVLQASGGGTYQWNTGSQSSSINVSQGGTYSVIVTDNGCTDQTSQTVTVNPLPNVTLASINDVCENATAVSLTGGMPMGGSYTVNGTPSTELNPSVTGSGTQTVAYEYTDNNGCTNTTTQTVTVNATPNVTLSGLNTSYTPTDSPSTLSGTPTGGVFNGSGVSNGMFDPAVAGIGTHGIMYTVVDGNGCVGGQALCTTVDINVNVGGGNIDTDGGTIDVYPNPSNGLFSISVDGIEGIINMVIYDSRGREIINESMVSNGQKSINDIDLNNYSDGVYTLQLSSKSGNYTTKLVKK